MLYGIATTASAPLGITTPSVEVETFIPPRDESVHDLALKKMMGKSSQVKEAAMKPTSSLDTGADDVKGKEGTVGKIDESIDRREKERENTYSVTPEEPISASLLPEDVFPPTPEDIFDPASGNLVGLMKNILLPSDEGASS